MLELAPMKSAAKTLILFSALAGIAVGQRPQTFDVMSDKQTLAGETRMAIALEMVSIPGYTFRADIENAIRQAGITVLASNDRAPAYPLLDFTIVGSIVNRVQPPQINYRVSLRFFQLFSTSNGKYMRASTWSSVHSGLTPWNGLTSGPQVIADVRREVMDMLSSFLEDWREVNSGAPPEAASSSHIFDGIWRGTYTCGGFFPGTGQSTWTIREVTAGKVEADEQWSRLVSGRYSYTGTISGRTLEVTTEEGGYSVQFTISDDGARLSGRYIGHPSQCQTVSLRKVQ